MEAVTMPEINGQLDPPLHIRRGMDVYSSFQNQYIGQVIKVWYGGVLERSDTGDGESKARESGSSTDSATQNPGLQHEGGGSTDPTRVIGRRITGEEEGPRPTASLGNTGPRNQSAGRAYATDARDRFEGVVYFSVRPGALNPFARCMYVPTAAVMSMSMERVVLDIQRESIPEEWRRPPQR